MVSEDVAGGLVEEAVLVAEESSPPPPLEDESSATLFPSGAMQMLGFFGQLAGRGMICRWPYMTLLSPTHCVNESGGSLVSRSGKKSCSTVQSCSFPEQTMPPSTDLQSVTAVGPVSWAKAVVINMQEKEIERMAESIFGESLKRLL